MASARYVGNTAIARGMIAFLRSKRVLSEVSSVAEIA